MADRIFLKGMIAGAAGGMVAAWAINRFYDMARESSQGRSMFPYLLGASIGATYATYVQRRPVPLVARVPLGAALWLGEPDETAAPPRHGHDIGERARNFMLRTAARRLRDVAERALHA
jgi:hypothetical protein